MDELLHALDKELQRASGGLVDLDGDTVRVDVGEGEWQEVGFLHVYPSASVLAWLKTLDDRETADDEPGELRRELRHLFGVRPWTSGRRTGSKLVMGSYFYPRPGWHPWVNDLLAGLNSSSHATDPQEKAFLDALAEDEESPETLAAYHDWLIEKGLPNHAGLIVKAIEEVRPIKVEWTPVQQCWYVYCEGRGSKDSLRAYTRADLTALRDALDRAIKEDEEEDNDDE